MLARALPCPNCGCGCTCDVIPATPQADASGVTQVSGSWTFAVTYLDEGVLTSSDNAILLHNTAMPSGMNTQYSEWASGGGDVGDDLRFIFLYNSSTDYWYAKVTPGVTDGQLRLFQVSAGPTHTQRGSTDSIPGLSTSEGVYVQACITTAGISLRATRLSLVPTPDPTDIAGVDYSASVTISGTKIGHGTGSIAGTCTFYYLVAARQRTDEDCDCELACQPFDDAATDDCTGQTLCCYGDTMPASLFLTVLDEAFAYCPNESTEEISGHELTKALDDCVQDPNGNPLYRWYYRTATDFSPQLCDFYRFATLSCHACRASGINSPCAHHGGSVGGPASYADGASLNFYSDNNVIPGSNCKVAANWDALCVEMDIIDCDPFYAESLDGKFIISE